MVCMMMNKILHPYDIMNHVLAATLASYSTGTRFKTRQGGFLIERLTRLFIESKHPLVVENMFIDSKEPFEVGHVPCYFLDKNRIDKNIGVGTFFGPELGLTNWTMDFDYLFDNGVKYLQARMNSLQEAKVFLGEEDYNYFKELGKNLPEIN